MYQFLSTYMMSIRYWIYELMCPKWNKKEDDEDADVENTQEETKPILSHRIKGRPRSNRLIDEKDLELFSKKNEEKVWKCSMNNEHPHSQKTCRCLMEWCINNPVGKI